MESSYGEVIFSTSFLINKVNETTNYLVVITFSLSSQIQTELPTASVVQRNAVPKGFPEEATSTIAGILQIFRRRYDGAYAAPFLSTTVSALRTRVTQSDTHIAFLPFPLSPTDCGIVVFYRDDCRAAHAKWKEGAGAPLSSVPSSQHRTRWRNRTVGAVLRISHTHRSTSRAPWKIVWIRREPRCDLFRVHHHSQRR